MGVPTSVALALGGELGGEGNLRQGSVDVCKLKPESVVILETKNEVHAGAGYLFTFYNAKVTEERKARIERINEQVKEMYGPLLAIVTASKSAFDAMVRQHSQDGSMRAFIRAARDHPESSEGQTYRHWMKTVLQPLNEKAAKIVTERADLSEGSSLEPLLLQLVAHVSAYRVILERWDAGDIHEWSAITYPDKLLGFVTEEFQKMKLRQAELLGMGVKSPQSKL